MKRVFRHFDRFEVYRVFHMLEEAHIPCFVKNELIQGAIGDVPPQDSEPEVWISDNDYFAKAERLIERFEQEQQVITQESRSAWCCTECKEQNEANFNLCWQCQASRV